MLALFLSIDRRSSASQVGAYLKEHVHDEDLVTLISERIKTVGQG